MSFERGQFLDLFVVEAREILQAAHDLLDRMEAEPGTPLSLPLMRHCHSLKGMAATMGFDAMVRVAHALEDLFESRSRTGAAHVKAPLALLREALDCIDRGVDRAQAGEDTADPEAERVARGLRRIGASAAGQRCVPAASENDPPPTPSETSSGPSCRCHLELELAHAGSRPAERTLEVLRSLRSLGRVEHVDPPRLSGDPPRFDGRISLVLRSAGDLASLRASLAALTGLRSFRAREEPPLRSPGPAPPAAGTWLRVRADRMDSVLDRLLDLILEQGRARVAEGEALTRHLERSQFLLKELYATITELRLVAFDTVADRLRQSVHRLAGELDKSVRFVLGGRDVRIDRSMLDALFEPLQHVVRNALDHGIERTQEREAAGKPARATLSLMLERRAGRIRITVADDGRGIDLERLRRVAVERGVLSPRRAAACSEEQVLGLITRPSLSTAGRVTTISGRGVGMDVVREFVDRWGGRLRLESRRNSGTSVTLDLPARLELLNALLVRSAGELFALPMALVQKTLDLPAAAGSGGRPAATIHLHRALGIPEQAIETPSRNTLLTVLRGKGEIGLLVDEVLGGREIVVRPLREPLAALRHYAGAALLDDGEVALVLDPGHLGLAAGET